MSNFQISSPNFTQMPNILFDEWLPLLGHAELLVLLVIYRKTFGYHKIKDKISLSQIQKISGLTRSNLSKAVKSLENKNLIKKTVIGKKGLQQTIYEIIIKSENSSSPPPKGGSPTEPGGSPATGLGGSPATGPTKEKEINKVFKEKEKEKEKKTGANAPLASDDAYFCVKKLFYKLKEKRSDRKEPNWNKWAIEMDRIIRMDKRSKENILQMIDWIFDTDNLFVVDCPLTLRRKYDKIADHMIKNKSKFEQNADKITEIKPFDDKNYKKQWQKDSFFNIYKKRRKLNEA